MTIAGDTAADGTDGAGRPHFVLVPLMAQGHTIPMSDMARLLAEHGAQVSFVTMLVNAARLAGFADGTRAGGLPIQLVELRFPAPEFGLPKGCENLDMIPCRGLFKNFLQACAALREPLAAHLRAQRAPPYIIKKHKIYEQVTHENELVVIPGFPTPLAMTKAKSPVSFAPAGMEEIRKNVHDEELRCDGVVMNSFHELESLHVGSFERAAGKKVWTIGPMCLCNRDIGAMSTRGNKPSTGENWWLELLD